MQVLGPAKIDININVKNSNLYWLPKELILFDNSKLIRNININLLDNSNLIFCESTIFGRKAMSEKFRIYHLQINGKLM